jgi:hypothetical protein
MDTVRRMKLQTLREKIVQDVHVEYIFDYLISKDVLSEDEMERIKGEVSLEVHFSRFALYTFLWKKEHTHIYSFYECSVSGMRERHWNSQKQIRSGSEVFTAVVMKFCLLG